MSRWDFFDFLAISVVTEFSFVTTDFSSLVFMLAELFVVT